MSSVHFVSTGDLDSAITRYRCLNLVEALGLARWQASCSWTQDPSFTEVSGDVVVLHRLLWSPEFEKLVNDLKALGKVVVYGVDDLLFSVEWPLKESSEYLPDWDGLTDRKEIWQAVKERQENTLKAMRICDCALVSTEFIAERARLAGIEAYVIRNFVSAEQMKLSSEAARRRFCRKRNVVLGYVSGSKTHNTDFGCLESALVNIMEKNANVTLQIAGPLSVTPRIESLGARVRMLPMVSWRDLPQVLASMDVNLSSLDATQAFNHAKSHIKWLESSVVGVPTVATRTSEFQLSISHGRTGFFADTVADWEEHITKLVDDSELRAAVGSAAYEAASREYSVNVQADIVAGVFESIVQKYGSPQASGRTVKFPRTEDGRVPPGSAVKSLMLRPVRWAGRAYRAAKSAFRGSH